LNGGGARNRTEDL